MPKLSQNLQQLYLNLLAAWGDSPLDEEEVKSLLVKALTDQLEEIEQTVNASPQPTMHHRLREKINQLKQELK
jgi:hypothetical protein